LPEPVQERAVWWENWQREIEGVYLYRQMASVAHGEELKRRFSILAGQEERHAKVWADQIAHEEGEAPAKPAPGGRVRMLAMLGRLLGPERIIGLLIRDEVADFNRYGEQARQANRDDLFSAVLADEAEHARTLAELGGSKGRDLDEPWHRGADASGWLRAVVYGFNDGLTANFGLVMGVVGAKAHADIVLLTGFAGLLADALSMAASGFLAARSAQEVRQHHLKLEKAELRFMPDEERGELERIYRRKGLTPDEASRVAGQIVSEPDRALRELASEELGIDTESEESPLQEGAITGIATGLGAFIPIIPFVFLTGPGAVWFGIGVSMLAHFAVGASRSLFTGRPAFRSGLEMFLVGMGVAIATYVIGTLFGVSL
jgi:VIT1/CCC1 family predicted Fe2+/Mn2+ transporter/rubrerythrin